MWAGNDRTLDVGLFLSKYWQYFDEINKGRLNEAGTLQKTAKCRVNNKPLIGIAENLQKCKDHDTTVQSLATDRA